MLELRTTNKSMVEIRRMSVLQGATALPKAKVIGKLIQAKDGKRIIIT
jgi:hypothetical protein